MSRKRKLDIEDDTSDDPFLLTQMVDENDRRREEEGRRAGIARNNPPAIFQQVINIPPGVVVPQPPDNTGAVVQQGARAASSGTRLKFIGLNNIDTQGSTKERRPKYKRQLNQRQASSALGQPRGGTTNVGSKSRFQFVTEPSEGLFEAHDKEIESEGLRSSRGNPDPDPKKRKLKEIIVIDDDDEDDKIVSDDTIVDDADKDEGWITIGKGSGSKSAATTSAATVPPQVLESWDMSMEEEIFAATDKAERDFQQKQKSVTLSKAPTPAPPPSQPAFAPASPLKPTSPSTTDVPEPVFVEHITEISLFAPLQGGTPLMRLSKLYVDSTKAQRPFARAFNGTRAAKQFANGYLEPSLEEFAGGLVLAALVCLRKSVSRTPRTSDNKRGLVKLNGPFALGYDAEEDALILYSGQESLGQASPLFYTIVYNAMNSTNNTAELPTTTLKFTLTPHGKHADRISTVKETSLNINTLDLGDIYAGIGAIRGKQLGVDYKQFVGRK